MAFDGGVVPRLIHGEGNRPIAQDDIVELSRIEPSAVPPLLLYAEALNF